MQDQISLSSPVPRRGEPAVEVTGRASENKDASEPQHPVMIDARQSETARNPPASPSVMMAPLIPPPDQGKQAWLVLAGAAMLQAPVWGTQVRRHIVVTPLY